MMKDESGLYKHSSLITEFSYSLKCMFLSNSEQLVLVNAESRKSKAKRKLKALLVDTLNSEYRHSIRDILATKIEAKSAYNTKLTLN